MDCSVTCNGRPAQAGRSALEVTSIGKTAFTRLETAVFGFLL